MKAHQKISAKSLDRNSRSAAIVVSFGFEWYESLCRKTFSSIIRTRAPITSQPRWLYFHINSPKSAICARAEIRSVESIDSSTAIGMAEELDLSGAKIREYIAGRTSVFCYQIKKVYFPKKEVTVSELNARMTYHPPQSFVYLSKDSHKIMDELCGFSNM